MSIDKKRTYYDALGISASADDAEIHKAYIRLARLYHPDVTGGDKAKAEKFKAIVEANEVLSDPEKRKRYDAMGSAAPVVIPSKRGRYIIEERIAIGTLADVYAAREEKGGPALVLKVARHPSVNDLLEREQKRLTEMWAANTNTKQYGYYYLPRLVDSFIIDNGARRRVNVLECFEKHGTIAEVRQMFPGGLNFRHAVWMFNRLLEALAFIHKKKQQIHGALTPDNVLVDLDPKGHILRLIDWGYAGGIGEKVRATSPAWTSPMFYAPEIVAKKPATPATDIYMAAQLIVFVMGGYPGYAALPSAIPSYLQRFLRGCLLSQGQRPQEAWALHEEFRHLMEKNFGPKQFVPFTNPAWTGDKE